jgi:ATP-dependent exoDNAse (exonuclease V) alpha subunit
MKNDLNYNKSMNEIIEFDDQFESIYNKMEHSNENIFITGKAGTGKTTLLEYFRVNSKKNFVILASTGISSIKAKGKTIHSFFLFPPRILIDEKIKRLRSKIIQKIDTILIDECSMIRCDVLDAIDRSLRLNRNSEKKFGGVQIVLLGDVYQLPPVIRENEKQIFNNFYPMGQYFFYAKCFDQTQFKTYELSKVFRQKDKQFINILNKIRIGNAENSDLLKLNNKIINHNSSIPFGSIILSTTNRKVDEINNANLQNIESETFSYTSVETGDFKDKPADQVLELKVGAQVMLIKNDNKSPKRWVNGSIGIVTELSNDSIHVKIKNKIHKINQDTWEKFDYLIKNNKVTHEVVATFTQYPIKLAWAVTIHKSQGQTFEKAIIDLDTGSFAYGQTYVALSRVTSLDGLFLTREIKFADIIFDKNLSFLPSIKP